MSQPRVFVSHSHKDDAFTQRLVDDLHRAGVEVWVDISGVTHGNFMERIDEALAKCEWMVVVLTPSAISSAYVRDEVYAALQRVKQGHMRAVVPIVAATCAPGSIPPQWDILHRFDATGGYEAALAGVLRAIDAPGEHGSVFSTVASVRTAPGPTRSASAEMEGHGNGPLGLAYPDIPSLLASPSSVLSPSDEESLWHPIAAIEAYKRSQGAALLRGCFSLVLFGGLEAPTVVAFVHSQSFAHILFGVLSVLFGVLAFAGLVVLVVAVRDRFFDT